MWTAMPFAAGDFVCLIACGAVSGGGHGGYAPPPINPPTITTQPANQTVNDGSAVTFATQA